VRRCCNSLCASGCTSISLVPPLRLRPADIDAIVSKVKFQLTRAAAVRVVRWDDNEGNDYEVWRPEHYNDLVSKLRALDLYSDADAMYYFPLDKINLSARVKLTESTFDQWIALDELGPQLPRIWIYPRVDDKSPDKPPSRATVTSPTAGSTATATTVRFRREEEFKEAVRSLDRKCMFPGCKVAYVPGATMVEAAHIIPRYILNIRSYKTSDIYASIMDAAGFGRLDVDHPHNGMLLCGGHHDAFDAFRWVVNPATLMVELSDPSNADTLGYKKAARVDFSHRPAGQRPSKRLWQAYYSHVYADAGKALKTAAKVEEGASSGAARKAAARVQKKAVALEAVAAASGRASSAGAASSRASSAGAASSRASSAGAASGRAASAASASGRAASASGRASSGRLASAASASGRAASASGRAASASDRTASAGAASGRASSGRPASAASASGGAGTGSYNAAGAISVAGHKRKPSERPAPSADDEEEDGVAAAPAGKAARRKSVARRAAPAALEADEEEGGKKDRKDAKSDSN